MPCIPARRSVGWSPTTWWASSGTRSSTRPDMAIGEQRRALLLVAVAAVLANASWFSATAVVPALQHDWHLTSAGAAWLVIMVQIGFVVGSVGAALLNLPDRIEPRRLIAG